HKFFHYYIPQTLRKVTITTDTDIPAKAFYNCSFLTEINIPDTVTTIGKYAFYNCSGIVSLETTEHLTSIGSNAFSKCSNLTVYGYRDSYADTYCTTNNVPFVAYDGIVSIAVKQLPVNMQYIGRPVDTMGFILTATLKDGTTVDFNTGYTLEPEMLTVEGANEIKVKFAGFEASFIANTSGVRSIEVADMPEKTEYFEGDVVDATGLTLNVTYNDGSTALICGGYDVVTTVLDYPGTTAVEIDYNGVRTSYNVTVKEVVMVDWSLLKAPNKLVYDIGEYINISGVVIRENYNNGTYVDVTSGFTCTPESFDRTGEFEVTVEYKDLTATFIVNVTEKVHEHTYKTTVIKAVTCLEDGIDLYSCGCGYSYEETVTAPGHSYNKVVTPPTCQMAGYTTYTCSRCSDSYVGDEDNNLRHWGGTANCKDKAICSTCGIEYGEINADNHKTVVIDEAVKATCTTTGLSEGAHCEACDVVIKKQTEVKVLDHSYTDWTITKEATIFDDGEKYRTCTVCQYVETVVIEKIVIDTEYNENYGIANFTILDATTKAPIKNASIFVSTDGEGESTFYTDSNGKVSIILPIGENIITAHSKGLISRTLTIDIVHGVNEIPAIGLSSSPIVEAELVTTPMTKEEIEDAGIDVTAPGNNNVIKYEVIFEFTVKEPEEGEEPKKETIKETFYVNGNGDHFYQNNNTTHEIFGKPVTIHPTERFYLIITGDIIWLKEMFHVQLYAYNNSNTDWIEDAVATLNLTDGLSLADMSEGEQTLNQQMGTIAEGGQADCEWYVRGDKEGIYDLTATLEGRIMPFNEEFSNEYTAEEAIKVYSGKAFNITFEVPSITYCDDEYPVKIILKNVSDKSIYNVAHVLTGVSQTKVTHYSNGEVVEEIYVKETLDKAKFIDEFGPGDEIVLEVTAKILFESEKYKDCFFELVDIIFGAKELGDAINNNFGFPTEHDWGEWETVKEPTCGETGEEKRVCKNNEAHIETREIETLPHDWNDGVIDPVSTCKDHGVKTYICKNDASHTKTELVPLDKDNHIGETYIKDAKENSCEEDGYTGSIHCLGCDVKFSGGEIIPAHGHDYHKIDEKCKDPDYGVAGYDYYECSYDASHYYTVEIAPLVKTTFTATFVTTAPFFKEDKIVAEVTFTQGDKFVAEPPVDKYDNYTFAWDEYELKDEDIVIYGRYTEIEINDVTEPDAEKKVEYNNGVVNITLEAKSDSKNIKILSEKTKPVDVILVLDQSGSMAETLSSNRKTKRDALVECANDFVNEIYENAVATGAQHRVAVVGFSYSDYNGGNYKNTGILATNNGSSVNYKSLKSSHYASALIPVVAANGINANITKGINSVVADGATSAHLGLEMANNIFAVTAKEADRERIVLFITDGTPTSWGEETDLVKTTAAKAITEAYELKNSHGAKVYSIGVHANADPTANFTSDMYGVKTDNRGTFKSYDFNRFLHAVSSNYKEAGSIVVSEMGEGSKNSGYYLGVKDTSKLSEIFSKILLSSVYEVKTFDKVTIVDTVSKEFTLTIEQESEMRERLIKELGIRNEDITVTRNDDGTTTLRFENVRAQKIYNDDGSSYYSAKVAFNVSADKDSLGLTEVNTNTEDAGVELDGETIDKFTVPSVTLEPDRKLVVFTINGVVYRIEESKLGDNIVAPESALAEWNIPEETVVDGDYVVFEANIVDSREYTVTWVSENSKITETYSFGEEIIVPEAAEKNGYEFLKWSPGVPETMPDYNITFTAVYTDKHTHEYKKSNSYGKCTEGITTVFECVCGDSYEETAEKTEHSAKAVVEQTSDKTTLIEMVICQVCGATNSQELTYNVTYKQSGKTVVLDLTLYDNEIVVQPTGKIEIKFYVGEALANKKYTVYRIDENGTKTTYTPRKEKGYLIFDADHFSFYVVTELDETTGEVADDMSYDEVYCISNGHSYDADVTAPTCTVGGYTTYTCSMCGDKYVDDETTALGHTKVTITGKGATCKAAGLTDGVKCGVCGEILTAQQTIAKLEHKDANGDYACD
ncbi:MAG: leucine-rich repeat protein, partial [Clostridia bacterium]|nr:leucine-rich repeat protein [Clostridia bacterium]